MKKITKIFLSALLLLSCLQLSIFDVKSISAADISYEDEGFTIVGTKLNSYVGNAEIVNIPEGIDSIASNAFKAKDAEYSNIKEIVIPKTLTSISMPFIMLENCVNLERFSVNVSEDLNKNFYLESIDGALYQVHKTSGEKTLVYYPMAKKDEVFTANNIKIDDRSFNNSKFLKKIVLEEEANFAFLSNFKNSSIEEFDATNANSYQSNEGVLFDKNGELIMYPTSKKDKSYVVPTTINGMSVTQIGVNAFKYNRNLEAVDLGNSIVVLGNYAFDEANSLRKIVFGTGIESIGTYAVTSKQEDLNITFHSKDASSIENLTIDQRGFDDRANSGKDSFNVIFNVPDEARDLYALKFSGLKIVDTTHPIVFYEQAVADVIVAVNSITIDGKQAASVEKDKLIDLLKPIFSEKLTSSVEIKDIQLIEYIGVENGTQQVPAGKNGSYQVKLTIGKNNYKESTIYKGVLTAKEYIIPPVENEDKVIVENGKVTIETKENGKVEFAESALPLNVNPVNISLKKEIISDENRAKVDSILNKAEVKNVKKLIYMDLSLVDLATNTKIELNGKISITLPYPAGYNQNHQFVLIHILADGSIEYLDVVNKKEGYQFETSSLGTFVLGIKQEGTVSDVPGNSPDVSRNEVKTGDDTKAMPFLMLLLGSCITITYYVIYKKRNTSK